MVGAQGRIQLTQISRCRRQRMCNSTKQVYVRDLSWHSTGRFTEVVVAQVLNVPHARVRAPGRGLSSTARARHVAMYLMHTGFGLTFTTAGRLFRRDRTTVAYACERIEDSRDAERSDLMLTHLECGLRTWCMAFFSDLEQQS